ncbi:hypothetical protein GN956_G9655 [Arapaima gigas]
MSPVKDIDFHRPAGPQRQKHTVTSRAARDGATGSSANENGLMVPGRTRSVTCDGDGDREGPQHGERVQTVLLVLLSLR